MERDKVIKALEFCAEHEYCVSCPCDNECIGMESLMLDALSLIKELTNAKEMAGVMIQLLEGDIADRDKMLEGKVEDVYADFMRDYKCMREELEGAYEMIADAKADTKADTVRKMQENLIYTLCINNEENTEFFDYAYTLETIDQIAKEMLEDGHR